jgi:hypothetical protein
MKRSGLAVVIALFSYTLADIMIWQRIFEAHNLAKFSYLYHPGWFIMLGGELALGALLLLPNWRAALFYIGGLLSAATCGLEDVLYYWFDGRPIPYRLPWLEANPWILFKPVTATNLLLSVSIWVVLGSMLFVFCQRHESASTIRTVGPEGVPSRSISQSGARLSFAARQVRYLLSRVRDFRGLFSEPL